jgi:hypothetical protein
MLRRNKNKVVMIMNALTFTAITCGTTGFALWLQRRYVLYNRLTSVLLVAIMGYTAGSFKLVEVSSANLAWVVKYILPFTLVSALMASINSYTAGLTSRLMRGISHTMIITITLVVILTILFANGILSKGLITEFSSATSLHIFLLTPKDPLSVFHSKNQIYKAMGLTINTLAISIAVLIPVMLKTAYRTIWLYVPLEEASEKHMRTKASFYTKPEQHFAWSLGLSISVIMLALICINTIAKAIQPLPILIPLFCIPLLFRAFTGIRNMASEFRLLATLGSHIFVFTYSLILGSCPWHTLSGGTVFLTILPLVLQILIILIAGYRFGVNIETLCTLFLALTCGPLIAALVCAAKNWEPLLPAAFLMGILAQGILWIICMFI